LNVILAPKTKTKLVIHLFKTYLDATSPILLNYFQDKSFNSMLNEKDQKLLSLSYIRYLVCPYWWIYQRT